MSFASEVTLTSGKLVMGALYLGKLPPAVAETTPRVNDGSCGEKRHDGTGAEYENE